MPNQNTAVNLDELEDTIERNRDLVADDTEARLDVGALTAQAVVNDYAETAANIKKVSDELGLVANRCEALLHELKDTAKVLNDAADNFSKRGKTIAEDLDRSAKNTQAVRAAAKEWIDKIATTSP